MQLSFVAGFLDNLEGATNNYLHGLSDPEMATCTIVTETDKEEASIPPPSPEQTTETV